MNTSTKVKAFKNLYAADLVGMRILVLGADEMGKGIAQMLEKEVFDTEVVNLDSIDNQNIESAMQNGELDVVINATETDLPFVTPAWITVLDLRSDHEGAKLLLEATRLEDDERLGHHCECGHDHHDHECKCGHDHHDHECKCGHDHHDHECKCHHHD